MAKKTKPKDEFSIDEQNTLMNNMINEHMAKVSNNLEIQRNQSEVARKEIYKIYIDQDYDYSPSIEDFKEEFEINRRALSEDQFLFFLRTCKKKYSNASYYHCQYSEKLGDIYIAIRDLCNLEISKILKPQNPGINKDFNRIDIGLSENEIKGHFNQLCKYPNKEQPILSEENCNVLIKSNFSVFIDGYEKTIFQTNKKYNSVIAYFVFDIFQYCKKYGNADADDLGKLLKNNFSEFTDKDLDKNIKKNWGVKPEKYPKAFMQLAKK